MIPAIVLSAAIATSCHVKEQTEEYLFTRTYSLMNQLFDDVYITKDFSVVARGTDTQKTACVAAVTIEPNLIRGEELQPYCDILSQAREQALNKYAEINKNCWELYEDTHR